jgi:molecular chaperone HscB
MKESMTDKSTQIAVSLEREGQTHECWSCGDMRAAHFCGSCGRVQAPVPSNYFTFFGLQRKLNIGLAQLERDFYSLSRKLHPDANAQASDREQDWSLEMTSLLNDAYRTLRDPIARTEYLLSLEGVNFDDQSKAATDAARASGEAKKQIVPPGLLEEVFELNMQLEEARMNKASGEEDPNLLRELQKTRAMLDEKKTALLEELHTAWNEWDALLDSEKKGRVDMVGRQHLLKKMVDVLNRRTYLRNLVRDVNEVLGI